MCTGKTISFWKSIKYWARKIKLLPKNRPGHKWHIYPAGFPNDFDRLSPTTVHTTWLWWLLHSAFNTLVVDVAVKYALSNCSFLPSVEARKCGTSVSKDTYRLICMEVKEGLLFACHCLECPGIAYITCDMASINSTYQQWHRYKFSRFPSEPEYKKFADVPMDFTIVCVPLNNYFVTFCRVLHCCSRHLSAPESTR